MQSLTLALQRSDVAALLAGKWRSRSQPTEDCSLYEKHQGQDTARRATVWSQKQHFFVMYS